MRTDPTGHDHEDVASGSRRALVTALAINTAFFVIEVIGAVLSGSLALLADAAHMLTDSASIGLALFAAWVATRPPDSRRTYGYHRAEVLGALANGLLLVAAVAYIAWDATRRLGSPPQVDPGLVILVGVLGLGANLAAAAVLTDYRDTLNVEGAFLHLLADAAGSVGAIIAGVVILTTGVHLVDPLVALLIAGLVLYSSRDLLVDSLNILLQGTPRDLDVDDVARALTGLEGVEDVHDLHAWAMDSRRTAVSAHVVVEPEADRDDLLRRCRQLLADRFSVDHATMQIEAGDVHETVDVDCYPAGHEGWT